MCFEYFSTEWSQRFLQDSRLHRRVAAREVLNDLSKENFHWIFTGLIETIYWTMISKWLIQLDICFGRKLAMDSVHHLPCTVVLFHRKRNRLRLVWRKFFVVLNENVQWRTLLKKNLPAILAKFCVTSTFRNMDFVGSFSKMSGLRSAAQWTIAWGYHRNEERSIKRVHSRKITWTFSMIDLTWSKSAKSHRTKWSLFARLKARPRQEMFDIVDFWIRFHHLLHSSRPQWNDE